MEKEEIIINLKIIKQLEKGQKLSTRDAYLNIETSYLFIPECVRRWRRQDNRNDSIKMINRIINESLKDRDAQMDEYIIQAKQGISNLKDTYSACSQTCARFDTILDKIKHVTVVDSVKTEEGLEDIHFFEE